MSRKRRRPPVTVTIDTETCPLGPQGWSRDFAPDAAVAATEARLRGTTVTTGRTHLHADGTVTRRTLPVTTTADVATFETVYDSAHATREETAAMFGETIAATVHDAPPQTTTA